MLKRDCRKDRFIDLKMFPPHLGIYKAPSFNRVYLTKSQNCVTSEMIGLEIMKISKD